MADKTCDLTELRRLAMKKAQGKLRDLRAAGIPVSSEIFGDILKECYTEGRSECEPASSEITQDQMDIVKKVCPVCVQKFTVKPA
jgi:hypothetical protein